MDIFAQLSGLMIWLLLWVFPLGIVTYVTYAVFSAPVRRRERARFFLDVLDAGLKRGNAPETTLVRAAGCRDEAPDVWFHLAAAHVEAGRRLGEALARVPRLLPPRLAAVLIAASDRVGVAKVLPACRQIVRDGLSHQHAFLNWQPVLFIGTLPMCLWVFGVLQIWVLPKYRMIAQDMVPEMELPASFRLITDHPEWLVGMTVLLLGIVIVAALSILGGSTLDRGLRRIPGDVPDRVSWHVPWRRRRLLRDFTTMLGLFLDEGLPEPEAVSLAARATGNRVMQRRAQGVKDALAEGRSLASALRGLDASGELSWRVDNAARGGGEFRTSLAGWCEALDARAFQQEQTCAQLVTAGLVALNGLIVACLGIGVFSVLVEIIEEGVLW